MLSLLCLVVGGLVHHASTDSDDLIKIPPRMPESITSLRDGSLLLGSMSGLGIARFLPSNRSQELFIDLNGTECLGVFSDAARSRVLVALRHVGLGVFSLMGRQQSVIDLNELVGGSEHIFNDITVHRPSGDVFITDTKQGAIVRVAFEQRGSPSAALWTQKIGQSVDGVEMSTDGRWLIVNTWADQSISSAAPTWTEVRFQVRRPPDRLCVR